MKNNSKTKINGGENSAPPNIGDHIEVRLEDFHKNYVLLRTDDNGYKYYVKKGEPNPKYAFLLEYDFYRNNNPITINIPLDDKSKKISRVKRGEQKIADIKNNNNLSSMKTALNLFMNHCQQTINENGKLINICNKGVEDLINGVRPVQQVQQGQVQVQGYQEQGYQPAQVQGYKPVQVQGYQGQGYPVQGYPVQGYPVQGNQGQGYPVQGYPVQGYQPVQVQGNPVQGYPVQGYPVKGFQPVQRYQGQGFQPVQGYPVQGYQGQGFQGQWNKGQFGPPAPKLLPKTNLSRANSDSSEVSSEFSVGGKKTPPRNSNEKRKMHEQIIKSKLLFRDLLNDPDSKYVKYMNTLYIKINDTLLSVNKLYEFINSEDVRVKNKVKSKK